VVATSASGTTFIETNLAQNAGSLSASGKQLVLIGIDGQKSLYLGGSCAGNGTNTLSGTINHDGAVSFTLNEGGNLFNASGILNPTDIITGTFQSAAGSACLDSGTFIARKTTLLSATFSGQLALWYGSDSVTATFDEKSDYSMTVTGTTSQTGPFTLTGYIAGNVTVLSGNIGGAAVQVIGMHATGSSGVPTVDVFDPSGKSIGTLTQQIAHK